MAATVSTAQHAAGSQRSPKADWWMLGVLALLYMLSLLNRQIVAMLAPEMAAELALDDFQLGMLMGPAFGLIFAIVGLPLGWVADNITRKWLILFGCLLVGLATFGKGFAMTFAAAFALRAIVGAGEAALSPGAYAMIADRFSEGRLATAMSVYNIGMKLGVSVAFLVGGAAALIGVSMRVAWPALAGFSDWRIIYILVGVLSALAALLMLTVREDRRWHIQAKVGERPRLMPYLVAEWRVILPLLAGFSLLSLAAYSLLYWAPTYISRHFGMPAERLGPILSLIAFIAASSLILKGIIIDFFFNRGMIDAPIRIYSLMLAPCVVLGSTMAWFNTPTSFLLVNAIVQIIAVPFVAYSIAGIQLFVPPGLRGQMTALFLMSYNLVGGGIGPMLTGAIVQFFFRDPGKLGYAIAVVNFATMVPAFVLIRIALPGVRDAIERTHKAAEATAPMAGGKIGTMVLQPN